MKGLVLFDQFAKGKSSHLKRTNNCVIYTRVSSKEQELGYSLETQRKACEEYAKKTQYSVMGIFGGTYESAKTDERKEFNRMLSFVKKSREKISYIIVYSVDRFSRSGANAIYIKDQLRDQGIYLVAVTQPGDASTSSGDFQQNIQIIFSQYDNQLRREKCMAGVKEALLKGEWCHKAPYGYDEIKENGKRKIVINEKGKLLQKAFYWKATERLTHTDISERLDGLGLKLDEKRLSGYFRNPFYCGLMAHSALKGQLVEGNQEKMVSKEIFLKVNEILSENKQGYSCHEESENIPLKRFLKCDHCGTFMRGYVVKAKHLPYYKCNTKGCCNNKSAKEIHGLFESVLHFFSLVGNEAIKGFVSKQIIANYNRAHKEKDQSKEALKRQITELEKKSERLEERLILEEINLELFNKYSEKFKTERVELEKNFIKSQKRVSNLEQCVNVVLDFASKLPSSWALMAYKDKQLLQFLLFPDGIRYSKKNNECRTTKINSVFSYISQLVRDMAEIKKGDIKLLFDIPHLVGPLGIEPSTHRL
jgi:site-specific DNA recombinase